MIIQHNLMAMNAQRQFNITGKKKAKSTEKLSSGYRINCAADDAAGLAMSEKMRRQIRGLNQAAKNIQDGVGYVQTGEGALNEVHDMLQRMNELAVKASNETNSDEDIAYIDSEVQQLKSELSRVFETTSFNEKLIWVPNMDELVQTGTEMKSTIKFRSLTSSIDTTNENAGVLPYSGLRLHADDNGVYASWKGFNGTSYQTDKIDWNTLESSGYSFKIEDYFPDSLKDSSGNPLFGYSVAFTPNSYATREDMIAAVNASACGSSANASYSVKFENASGAAQSYPGITVWSGWTSYDASYVSHANGEHTFDAADDPFIEAAPTANLTSYPSASTVEEARNSSDRWTFTFNVDGIGTVTATSTSGSYRANNDMADDDENYWWGWNAATINGVYNPHYSKGTYSRSIDGTLGSVMGALTGRKGESTPGLLSYANGGDADTGGKITLDFTAKAGSTFSSGSASGSNVFSFSLEINVSNTDTEEQVFQRIKNALNENTRLDVATASSSSEYVYLAPMYSSHQIEIPVYGPPDGITQEIPIQAGAEANQHIDIRYKCLNLDMLGLTDTNTLTYDAANDAIEEIKGALTIVNEQRAVFGAYQNRLEHAYNINKNTEENTQYAESEIRDTDMAKEAVQNSMANIVVQVGQSMISQANQTANGVLNLLQ